MRTRRCSTMLWLTSTAAVAQLALPTRGAQACTLDWASARADGTAANGPSFYVEVSANGRWVGFGSDATDFVPGDTNGARDLFVRDRTTGTIQLVSVSLSGVPGNGVSNGWPYGISDAGSVAFHSSANDLVPSDTNGRTDVFVRNLSAGTTERVSVSSSGAQCVRDSFQADISADGRYVAFVCAADGFLASMSSDGVVFLKDRQTGMLSAVSMTPSGTVPNGGSGHPCISADGRYVGFTSAANDLIVGDTNGQPDCFVVDRQTGTTQRVSVLSGGAQFLGFEITTITPDGRFASFLSAGPTGGQGYVHDLWQSVTEMVARTLDGSAPNGQSSNAALSSDGRFAYFASIASNLVAGDTNNGPDVFVLDRATGVTKRVNVSASGQQSTYAATLNYPPVCSTNGHVVCFSGLDAMGTSAPTGMGNAFARECTNIEVTTYCTAKTNSLGCLPAMSFGGTASLANSSFVVGAVNLLNNKSGLLFWGYAANSAPFQGGVLCVQPPTFRTSTQSSSGNANGSDCSGAYAFAWTSNYLGAAGLASGTDVFCQFWSRDPSSASTTGLTDAVTFRVSP